MIDCFFVRILKTLSFSITALLLHLKDEAAIINFFQHRAFLFYLKFRSQQLLLFFQHRALLLSDGINLPPIFVYDNYVRDERTVVNFRSL